MIILDTNVVSELMRRSPSAVVAEWVRTQRASSLYTTTITEAEILFGVALLPKGKRRDSLLLEALAIFAEDFFGRVLPFASDAAESYARIAAERTRRGARMSSLDAQIAGIARAAGATLATRNTADFVGCGIDLVDPWKDPIR